MFFWSALSAELKVIWPGLVSVFLKIRKSNFMLNSLGPQSHTDYYERGVASYACISRVKTKVQGSGRAYGMCHGVFFHIWLVYIGLIEPCCLLMQNRRLLTHLTCKVFSYIYIYIYVFKFPKPDVTKWISRKINGSFKMTGGKKNSINIWSTNRSINNKREPDKIIMPNTKGLWPVLHLKVLKM